MGEIWISSPSIAEEYVGSENNSDLNRRLASGEDGLWFASGDAGFVHNGEVFVMGPSPCWRPQHLARFRRDCCQRIRRVSQR